MRRRHGEHGVYTNIHRAPAEPNVAICVGGQVNSDDNTLYRAEGAIQYQQEPAVRLADDDPGIIVTGSSVVREHFKLSEKEMAQAVALTENERVEMDKGQPAHRYETPVSSIAYIPRPRLNNRVGSRAVGIIAVSNKQDQRAANHIYFADLYS